MGAVLTAGTKFAEMIVPSSFPKSLWECHCSRHSVSRCQSSSGLESCSGLARLLRSPTTELCPQVRCRWDFGNESERGRAALPAKGEVREPQPARPASGTEAGSTRDAEAAGWRGAVPLLRASGAFGERRPTCRALRGKGSRSKSRDAGSGRRGRSGCWTLDFRCRRVRAFGLLFATLKSSHFP
jgi:hypothetical protein